MKAKLLLSILALLIVTAGTSQSQTTLGRESGTHRVTISIHTGWQFREAGKDKWYPASVPGFVHTYPLSNKLIDDPFYRYNEKKLNWIGTIASAYQTTINATAVMLKQT